MIVQRTANQNSQRLFPTRIGKKWQPCPELQKLATVCSLCDQTKESDMPIFILWAIPAIVVLGGGTYLLFMR